MPTDRVYATSTLAPAAVRALEAVGVPAEDAALVADSLLTADRRGVHSHGLLRLPLYIAALEAGGMNPRPQLRWRSKRDGIAVLDADSALGQVAMREAVARVAELAHAHGIGAVAVEHSTHYGAGAYWSDLLVDHGLIGIITSTTGPVVAPFGGTHAVLGTNPLTIAAPSADGRPLTADMATSAGAYGKVLAARNAGTSIPDGWAVGPDGEPTVDPDVAIRGSLLTFGGHKGSAIAVLLEVLAASLTDAAYAAETVDIWSTPASRMNTGHLVIALDPAAFGDAARAAERVATMQERVRDAGAQRIPAPGDPEADRFEASAQHVRLAESTAAALDALYARWGIDAPQPVG